MISRAAAGKLILVITTLIATFSLAGCGRDKVRDDCLEPQAYQSVVPGKKIEVPEDLDPLDEFKEMPIPEAMSTGPADKTKCLQKAPSVLS